MIAITGNEPAVTKRQQRINLDGNIVLSDTPGILWPNVENKNSGYRLAATGAIKDTAIDYSDVAFFTAEYLLNEYPEALKTRFQLETLPDNESDLMELIGKKRGCLRAGKQVDIEKISKILISEFRAGTIGKITLETPKMIEKELVELAQIKEQKDTKKKNRKQKWKNSR
jgi:ribosome biogenesis GTPase A